ncbi:MAG: GldG family protein, partial [Treponemataceae bacterium]|nr:GldG family protein [Treponemataceae bacterium]
MKKIIEWMKSPASDFALFILLLVLANIAGHNAFLRFDLTEQKSYSISAASRQTVSTLTEPLSVKVFFSDNLPSPYNGVAQYVRDILVEYKGAANRNFSYTFFDMNKPESQRIAQDYGLRQVQIQEVKNNEVGFKQAWMGLAVSYGDAIEILDGITSDSGFEYNLTTKIAGMISKADTLSGLGADDVISMTLYATDALGGFRINGFKELDSSVQAAFNDVNKKSMNRMTYLRKNPTAAEADGLAEKYGLQTFKWQNKDGGEGVGVFGLVLE